MHRASVIWLHGLGADGNDFAPIVPDLELSDEQGLFIVAILPLIMQVIFRDPRANTNRTPKSDRLLHNLLCFNASTWWDNQTSPGRMA